MHNIHVPPALEVGIMGPEPGRWCKFHKIKGHHTEDRYQLKKDIERLIHEERLSKYVKGDHPQGSYRSNSRGRDNEGSTKSRRGKESSK